MTPAGHPRPGMGPEGDTGGSRAYRLDAGTPAHAGGAGAGRHDVGREALRRLTWAGILLAAFALRAHRLAAQSLWSDEDITLDRAALPVREILATLPVEHTPLYFVMLRVWQLAAGATDYLVRFPSLMAGVAAAAVGGYVASRLAGRRAGLVMTLIMAVNPFLVWYGQEARMYAVLSALGLLALGCALRGRDTGAARWWLATGALAALTVYTHYYGALTVLVLGAWAGVDLVAARSRPGGPAKAARGWALAGVTAAGLFLPWAGRVPALLGFEGWREPLPLGEIPRVNLEAWTAGSTAPEAWIGAAVAVYAGLALVGLLAFLVVALRPGRGRPPRRRHGRARSEGVGIPGLGRAPAWKALAFALVPVAASALMAQRSADFHPRYYAAVVPALFLAAAAGAAALPGRWGTPAASAAILLVAWPSLGRLYMDPAAQKQNYRAYAAAVEQAAGHEDTVLFLDGPSYGLTRRYEPEDSPVKIVNLLSSGNLERSDEERRARIAELATEYPHLWLATDGSSSGMGQAWLDAETFPLSQAPYQDLTLRRYLAADASGWTRHRDLRCAEAIPLCADVTTPAEVRPGEALPILVTWFAGPDLPPGLKSSVRLRRREEGAVDPVAAQDLPLAGGQAAGEWSVAEHGSGYTLAPGDARRVFGTTGTVEDGGSGGVEDDGAGTVEGDGAGTVEDGGAGGVEDATGEGAAPRGRVAVGPPARFAVGRHGLLLHDDVATGVYVVRLVVYDGATLTELGSWEGPAVEVVP